MDRILFELALVLAVAVIVALAGCGGYNVTNPSRVVCFSGGQLIAEYNVPSIVWRTSSRYSFDLADGTAVSVHADCIVEEIQN